jgi:hypothetical protein
MAYEHNGDVEIEGNLNVNLTADNPVGTLLSTLTVTSEASATFTNVESIPIAELQALTFPGTPDGETQYIVQGMIRTANADTISGNSRHRVYIRVGTTGGLSDALFLAIPDDHSNDGSADVHRRTVSFFFLYTPTNTETVTFSGITEVVNDNIYFEVGSFVSITEWP